jgi:hypothetical protein
LRAVISDARIPSSNAMSAAIAPVSPRDALNTATSYQARA